MDSRQESAALSSGPPTARGLQLPPIQTSFNNKPLERPQRRRPVETVLLEKCVDTAPTKNAALLDQQRSKSGFFGLFSRNKSRKSTKVPEVSAKRQVPESVLRWQNSRRNSEQCSSTPNALASPPQSDGPVPILQNRTPKFILRSKLDKEKTSTKSLASWEPPDLFKAYPQAVKHARLRAPPLQAEAILQLYEERKSLSLEQNGAEDHLEGGKDNSAARAMRKSREINRRSKSSTSDIMCPAKWTEKIYVLATSGYLLQYAGAGAYDRLPERVMPLGKDSAAFASDAILGECYVLQVSRTTNEEGAVNLDSKSPFKKLGFWNEWRRSASSLLLVFDSPEEMNVWLVLMRREIEALGGRKYCPDVLARKNIDETVKILRERPSRRYLIKRDPKRFAEEAPEIYSNDELVLRGNNRGSTNILRRPSEATLKSEESMSHSNGTKSMDQIYLDRLRETPRMSYVSAGAKTLSTSRDSSPDPSPARAVFCPEDLVPKTKGNLTITSKASQSQLWMKRTIHTVGIPQPQMADGSSRAISMYGSSAKINSSTTTTEFSTPGFSKRYSCATGPGFLPKTPIPVATASIPKAVLPHMVHSQYELLKQRNLSLDEWPIPKTPSLLTAGPLATSSSQASISASPLTSLSTSELTLSPSKSDQPPPRRYSSLEYTGGSTPYHSSSNESPPHPPPTIALPALPESQSRDQRRSRAHSAKPRKSQRPMSMQTHSDPITRANYRAPKTRLQSPPEVLENAKPAPTPAIPRPTRAPPPPPISIPQPNIQNRKSMPQIIHRQMSNDQLSKSSLLPDMPFLLDSENNSQYSFIGPWNSLAVKGHQGVQETSVK